MKRVLLIIATLLLSVGLYAQNCGTISDEAGVLTNTAAIEKGAEALINQGADVHVVTVANLAKYGARLADVEKAYESRCPNWLVPNGTRKANLFVIMVAPNDRLKNAFFGGAYAAVYGNEDTVNTIYSQAANPYFRQKQFADGIGAALKDFGAKVAAFHDQQKHPATTTINQQATDLSGFWKVLGWLLVLLALGGAIWLTIYLIRRRREIEDERQEAQNNAVTARRLATAAFKTADTTAVGYSAVAATYLELSSSLTDDPTELGLSAATYRSIADRWGDLYHDITRLRKTKSSVDRTAQVPAALSAPYGVPVQQPVDPYGVVPGYTTSPRETVVINNGPDLLTTALVTEEIVEEHHHHHHHRDDDSSSSSSSSSDWGSSSGSSSGSDSNWSSSDSSSSGGSSGSDSSWSSSSFDSGSSFSGGSDSSW